MLKTFNNICKDSLFCIFHDLLFYCYHCNNVDLSHSYLIGLGESMRVLFLEIIKHIRKVPKKIYITYMI